MLCLKHYYGRKICYSKFLALQHNCHKLNALTKSTTYLIVMYIKETCFCNILYFASFQLGLIFGTLWSLPVIGILLNTETILLLIGQEQRISALAQQYTQLFFPGVFAYCWLFLCMRYLVCQVYLLSKEMGFK